MKPRPHPLSRQASRRIEPLSVLPVFFALEAKRAIVIGGSAAAAWKAELLAAAGAHVDIYAVTPGEEILLKMLVGAAQVRYRADGTMFYESGSSKNFDSCAPMGPYILTADEIKDPQSLWLKTHVNDELRQNNTTANMIFPIAQLIHFFSTFLTLYPGYAIASGTPGGTAWSTDKELGGRPYARNDVVRARGYLQVGDVVRCEIEKLGELRNAVGGPQHP